LNNFYRLIGIIPDRPETVTFWNFEIELIFHVGQHLDDGLPETQLN